MCFGGCLKMPLVFVVWFCLCRTVYSWWGSEGEQYSFHNHMQSVHNIKCRLQSPTVWIPRYEVPDNEQSQCAKAGKIQWPCNLKLRLIKLPSDWHIHWLYMHKLLFAQLRLICIIMLFMLYTFELPLISIMHNHFRVGRTMHVYIYFYIYTHVYVCMYIYHIWKVTKYSTGHQ